MMTDPISNIYDNLCFNFPKNFGYQYMIMQFQKLKMTEMRFTKKFRNSDFK